MNDRDCESCKKFSRNDPHESEGYCDAKRTWVDPQEGEDCKMHEFTLHSATKYKDGTPIMSEPEKVYCDTDSALIHYWKTRLRTLVDKHICPFLQHDTDSNLRYLEQTFTEFAKVQDDLIEEQIHSEPPKHNCNNFCGNCYHCDHGKNVCVCKLTGEVIDPDESSCLMFEPPF